ncbi:type II toxin-antitoxin system prevent-host-death family antitoxin [Leptospira sp. 2 VSF19]|uniref:Antitoxin n=1 Tax=Leptospira soteropolitanensis TaxID=2950025 RepID=A0AAW5VL22_9LEPT|nr:type II toxin-antitoxin system prevent-host-death family antitoxin [Leptospira soteropolitanensis]MCW7492665.1 type II toxin-antitoxin system prevent-host-death family antitoxin [Leptospira soteropolitanensis]MCW7500348.1 type II toxin-antitoxin system prevent-host-death family antitoxin [Leptospira soteropolitanensis]MCW7522617.1 type II toxin-antitoxin system prevent-host-death family antitoxin [Leptospira soteropolitanensis]MCW7526473.1 type II toxin-antitoxin system prevent-host-death fa
MEYNIHDAKSNLSKLIVQALEGKEVIISKSGKPIVKLVRITPDKKLKRKIGLYQGKLKISESFFEPLPEDTISGFHS